MNNPDTLERMVLGHNSFFGVNHLSRQLGASREALFEDAAAIFNMIKAAEQAGVSAMMMSTHPRAAAVADLIRAHGLRDRLTVYPLLPYIMKYIRQANEKGLVNVIFDQLKHATWSQSLATMARGGVAVFSRNYRQILQTMIDVELAPFSGLKIGAVFLHDVLTDLALALDLPEVFEIYVSHVTRTGAQPGFATKNLPTLVRRFETYGFERPLVLTQINKLGFGMNPSREDCERALQLNRARVMAMGTLASGCLRPNEAFDYVFRQPGVESIVVGVSTPAHAAETFDAARQALARM